MKILVIGLDGASPELLFGDERLKNIRWLMDAGCYGPVESPIPSTAVPAWICMATSQDPGTLGVYGLDGAPHHPSSSTDSPDVAAPEHPAIWDVLATHGKRAVTIGVPFLSPTGIMNGVHIGCALNSDAHADGRCAPPDVYDGIRAAVEMCPVAVPGSGTLEADALVDAVYAASRAQFDTVRQVLQHEAWDYLQFVEIGLDRLQQGLWHQHDPADRRHATESPQQDAVRAYFQYLDDQIGTILELLNDETVVLIVSTHSATAIDGAVFINEWLIQQGFLALDAYPDSTASLSDVKVNWTKTRAWAVGGDYAHIYLNVRGRDPDGIVEPDGLDQLRDELAAQLTSITDAHGEPLVTAIAKSSDLYATVSGSAPDLTVCFRDLHWYADGAVGERGRTLAEIDGSQAGCANVPSGCFILAAPSSSLEGEIERVHLLDLAPTLLEVSGYPVPSSMHGRSLAADDGLGASALEDDEEELIRERLRGLGYIG